ncbi:MULTISPECIES: hypothetical protein [unclassified Fibrobacter]|uniref:hypothetical protein n=1 Tax=unclassified Fibrobacter TaxID=2634177 RepID=UPI0011147775|nr:MULTISPECIES: hypothetical protein [Fibrobacter]MCQ2099582.1 hypothetical protein [Fibrobacter sp.]
MSISIPASYKVDSVEHWDMGKIYHIKNSNNEKMMFFYSGWRTMNSLKYEMSALTDNLKTNNRIDTVESYNERQLKNSIFVLQAKRKFDGKDYPYIVEFSCYPDFSDLATCEKIVSSAKMNH